MGGELAKEVAFILCFVNYFEQVYFTKINDLLLIRLCQVGVRNQQDLYPRIPTIDVANLLHYSGSRVEREDGFSS